MLVWTTIIGGIALLHVIGVLLPAEEEPQPQPIRVRD